MQYLKQKILKLGGNKKEFIFSQKDSAIHREIGGIRVCGGYHRESEHQELNPSSDDNLVVCLVMICAVMYPEYSR